MLHCWPDILLTNIWSLWWGGQRGFLHLQRLSTVFWCQTRVLSRFLCKAPYGSLFLVFQTSAWLSLFLLMAISSFITKWGCEHLKTLCWPLLSYSCFMDIDHFHFLQQRKWTHGCWLLSQDYRNWGIYKALNFVSAGFPNDWKQATTLIG